MAVLRISRAIALLMMPFLLTSCSCRREEPPPLPLKNKVVPSGTQTLTARLPRQASPSGTRARRVVLSLKFVRYPLEVQANHKFAIQVQVSDAFGVPLKDKKIYVNLSLAKAPPDIETFSQGNSMRETVNGVATFEDLELETPGEYVIEASAQDEKITGETLRIIAELPRLVNLSLDGKVTKAKYQPPDTYTTVDGDTYTGIRFGKSIFVVDGIRYEVIRREDSNLEITTLPPEKP